MKKILTILLITLLLTGCKMMKLNDGVTEDTPVSFTNLPDAKELVTVDEETTTSEELAGDIYIITATKGEKTETLELPVTFETVDIDGILPLIYRNFTQTLIN